VADVYKPGIEAIVAGSCGVGEMIDLLRLQI
jgi:hypothetical protein